MSMKYICKDPNCGATVVAKSFEEIVQNKKLCTVCKYRHDTKFNAGGHKPSVKKQKAGV